MLLGLWDHYFPLKTVQIAVQGSCVNCLPKIAFYSTVHVWCLAKTWTENCRDRYLHHVPWIPSIIIQYLSLIFIQRRGDVRLFLISFTQALEMSKTRLTHSLISRRISTLKSTPSESRKLKVCTACV